MDKILIDSDIVLDFYLKRQPFEEYAIEVFTLCANKLIEGYVTPVIISNAYYVFRQKSEHTKVLAEFKKLLQVVDIVAMDKEVVLNAVFSEFADFEDALQYFAAAKHGNIDLILTRNVKDYKKSEIPVMTPEAYLESRNSGRT